MTEEQRKRASGQYIPETNEFVMCLKCQMSYLPKHLDRYGHCPECQESGAEADVVISDAIDLLEDIVNEFGDKDQVILSMDRIREILHILKK